ncbi:PKD domain-containing protein [uncultured Microbulbifer sp.]|uniref:PKD domain-containing protein n=1 Tax=uncultured Microbulbifer sp. TaxID=348147 RepID=UPI0025D13C0F|nr:PKD domain-containing protein [uncultured Microbulbifer sp.]
MNRTPNNTLHRVMLLALTFIAGLFSAVASAHTVQICWRDDGSVTTFYAGTYHNPTEGPSPVGSIIIDGFDYPFTGWIYPSELPADAHCWADKSYAHSSWPDQDGVPHSGVRHFQTFTGAFDAGLHSFSFTTSTVIESPWSSGFIPQTFGGGACADADFDGICNADDACPLDQANDGDGDGICGNVDNCPLDANPGQTDANGNGQGDACEGVICGNGLLQGSEACDDGNIQGGDGCSNICTLEVSDTPPVANAGPDASVNEEQLVQLDGSASNDADGDPMTFSWSQVSGTPVVLSDSSAAQPTFDAPAVALGGETLTFDLTVTANGASSNAQVSIAVVNINHVPVAEAGEDLSVAEGAPVNLDGNASFDGDNDLITYTWTQVSGPAVTLAGANTASPSFTAPLVDAGGVSGVVATLVFQLLVDDGFPADAPTPGYTIGNNLATVTVDITNINNAPVAHAGTDITVNESNPVQLNGNGSSDPDSDALSFSWVQVGGPTVTLTGADTATPSITAPFVSPGGEALTFKLTVGDGYSGYGSDEVVVNVQNANDPPLVSAARPSVACMWPPNHNMLEVRILGVSDPEDNATIVIDSVTSDEPTNGTGDGDTAIDAVIYADGTALLRAERAGNGDGRVYRVNFTASDFEGSASGSVDVCVRHNKKQDAAESGQYFDATQ